MLSKETVCILGGHRVMQTWHLTYVCMMVHVISYFTLWLKEDSMESLE